MQSKYLIVSGIVFGGIGVLQAARALNEWPVRVGNFNVPVWVSWVAMSVAGSLCLWAFWSRKK